jgi:hypothetical protein
MDIQFLDVFGIMLRSCHSFSVHVHPFFYILEAKDDLILRKGKGRDQIFRTSTGMSQLVRIDDFQIFSPTSPSYSCFFSCFIKVFMKKT